MTNKETQPNTFGYNNTQKSDHVAGHIMLGKRWNKNTQKEEPAAFLNIYIYQVDENNDPKIVGTRKFKDQTTGKETEVPSYNIIRSFRVPLSTLHKVVNQESKRCQFYYSEPKPQY